MAHGIAVYAVGPQKDAGDQALASLSNDVEVGVSVIRKKEEQKRKEAELARLQAGKIGICIDCDDPISEARLNVMPFALRCTPCESAEETRQKYKPKVPTRAF